MNAIKRQELIDADFQRLRSSSGRRMTGNDPEPPTVATERRVLIVLAALDEKRPGPVLRGT